MAAIAGISIFLEDRTVKERMEYRVYILGVMEGANE
jgi:hypothetical protein